MSDYNTNNNREYTNGEITVYWKPSECIHATICYRDLIEVFNPRKRPWVNMKGASTREIIKVVEACPTNALTYKWNKEIEDNTTDDKDNIPQSNKEEKTPLDIHQTNTEVRVMNNGPLLVKGEFKIIGADGKEISKKKMASFCRCGQSMNMPFCDGMHRKIGFSG